MRRALDEVRELARSARWISWWRRRYTLTAANALLGALGRLTHGLDSDALILDLDPDDETLAWITETGPGGVGAVEACLRAMSELPQLLSYALASALMPTDVETMDAEMVAVISLGRPRRAPGRRRGDRGMAPGARGREAGPGAVLRCALGGWRQLPTARVGLRYRRGFWDQARIPT